MSGIVQRIDSPAPTFIVWNDAYSVGNDQLDEHHRRILAVVNQLYTAMREGTGQRLVRPILDELDQSLPPHCQREEAWMELHEFPELANHKARHWRLMRAVDTLQGRIQRGPVTRSADLFRFMKSLWMDHICGADQQYAAYILRRSTQHAGHPAIPPLGAHIEAIRDVPTPRL
jgi:hemerythrin-like metal-binding protein